MRKDELIRLLNEIPGNPFIRMNVDDESGWGDVNDVDYETDGDEVILSYLTPIPARD